MKAGIGGDQGKSPHGTQSQRKLASSVCSTCSATYSLKAKEYGPRERKLGPGLPSAFPDVQTGALPTWSSVPFPGHSAWLPGTFTLVGVAPAEPRPPALVLALMQYQPRLLGYISGLEYRALLTP